MLYKKTFIYVFFKILCFKWHFNNALF